MSPEAERAFTKLVAQNGLLYPATSTRPMRSHKSALRRLRREVERRYPDAQPVGRKGAQA